jgi:two-component SAPR family response regulator
MPDMNGFELYNKIKKTDSKVNVCFITAIDKSNYKGFEQKKQDIGRQEKLSEKYCVLNKNMFLQKPEINKRMRD